MKEKQLVELLNRHMNSFLNNIAIELEKPHHRWFDDFGFPLFGETSKDYHEQVYFQSSLESYIRKMINCILREICEDEIADEIEWPELDYKGIYNGYTNIESEKEFGFEFIDRDEKTGYRYTSFYFDEIDDLIKKGNIDHITIIEWQQENETIGYTYSDDRVNVISLWEYFRDILFYDEDNEVAHKLYAIFVDKISLAVTQANSMISLVTLPGFTPSYIHRTRQNTLNTLNKEISELSCFSIKSDSHKDTEDNSRKLVEEYNLPRYFIEKKLGRAFVGLSQYAKSFMTSEYLFNYFQKNPMFDYTPIVSGYIKSIEQLLHTICVGYRDSRKIYIDMKSYTLGSYTEFLNGNIEILRESVRPAKDIIVSCLNSYRIESRNHLFHKDYFDNWERVESIRNNTIFLYATLLGATDNNLLTDKALGYLKDDYDRLFDIIDNSKENYYSIKLFNKEYIGMRKDLRSEGITFNKFGLINTKITFRKFDYDHEEVIEISPKNIPSEIWATDIHGKKLRKIWSLWS